MTLKSKCWGILSPSVRPTTDSEGQDPWTWINLASYWLWIHVWCTDHGVPEFGENWVCILSAIQGIANSIKNVCVCVCVYILLILMWECDIAVHYIVIIIVTLISISTTIHSLEDSICSHQFLIQSTLLLTRLTHINDIICISENSKINYFQNCYNELTQWGCC